MRSTEKSVVAAIMAVAQDDHWIEAQKRLIKEAFALFDKDKKGKKRSATSLARPDMRHGLMLNSLPASSNHVGRAGAMMMPSPSLEKDTWYSYTGIHVRRTSLVSAWY